LVLLVFNFLSSLYNLDITVLSCPVMNNCKDFLPAHRPSLYSFYRFLCCAEAF
jgi:hypothetical protein